VIFDFLKKILDTIFPPENLETPPLEPVMNLKRVKANVKVTWDPNPSADSKGQKIIVVRDGEQLIDKMLEPETAAFSFAAKDNSKIILTVIPYNGTDYGDSSTIEFVV